MLTLQGATYRHAGATADSLDDVSLELTDGSLTGLLGASGSGLSTLSMVLSGLAPRVVGGRLRGNLTIDGDVATQWPMHRLVEHVVVGLGRPAAQLSMVAETVFEEVAFGPANLGLSRTDVVARTRAALDSLDITDLAVRDPGSLSGGEQQRVVLAGLLAMGPRHLVLDGPLAHLDPLARGWVLDALRAISDDGSAVLVAEHRRKAFSDSVRWDGQLSMAEGHLVERGHPRGSRVSAPSRPGPPHSHADAPDIRLEGVSHRYASGVRGLEAVDLTIRGGEGVAIVGTNGSGKTTLLRHLDGLLRPTTGRVTIGGADAASRSVADLARSVALGFQDPDRQVFARSVLAEVGFGPQQLGRDGVARDRAVDAALRAVGLDGARHAHPADLGTSQRKLLAIASLLAMECPVLILDEPTAELDDAGALVVEAIVAQQRAMGRTIVAVSHDEGFVARSFERVVRIDGGRIVADGPPDVVPAAG